MILMSIGDSKIFLANPKPARIPPQTPSMREISTGVFCFPVECREAKRHYLP